MKYYYLCFIFSVCISCQELGDHKRAIVEVADLERPQSQEFVADTAHLSDLEAVLRRIPSLENFAQKVKQVETVPELLEFIRNVLLWMGNANNIIPVPGPEFIRAKIRLRNLLVQLVKVYETYASWKQKVKLMQITQRMTHSQEFATYKFDDTVTKYFSEELGRVWFAHMLPSMQVGDAVKILMANLYLQDMPFNVVSMIAEFAGNRKLCKHYAQTCRDLALEKIRNGDICKLFHIHDIFLAVYYDILQQASCQKRPLRSDLTEATVKPEQVFALRKQIKEHVVNQSNLDELMELLLQEKIREMRGEPLQFVVGTEQKLSFEGMKFQFDDQERNSVAPFFAIYLGTSEIYGARFFDFYTIRSDPEFLPFVEALNASRDKQGYVTEHLPDSIIDHVLENNALIILWRTKCLFGRKKCSNLNLGYSYCPLSPHLALKGTHKKRMKSIVDCFDRCVSARIVPKVTAIFQLNYHRCYQRFN